jgi:transposase
MIYLGVDAHKRTSYLCACDQDGREVLSRRIKTCRRELHEAIAELGGPVSSTLEASYCWGPVFDWLGEVCSRVELAHPGRVRLIAESMIKTDRIDAGVLAALLRAGLLPTSYASSAAERSAKRVLRHRCALVGIRTQVKNRIHSLLSQQEVEPPPLSDLFGASGLSWLRGVRLPGSDGRLLSIQLQLLDQLSEHIRSSNALIARLAAGDAAVSLLRSVPGLGVLLSVLIRVEVGEIARFRSPAKLVSYAGLAPATYSSAGRTRHGHLLRSCNRWLRWAFIEAVAPALRADPALGEHYQSLKSRRCSADARASTARKIAVLAWHVWKRGSGYERR